MSGDLPGIGRLPSRFVGFSKISDEFARDGDLPARARSVLLYILSHREGFQLTQRTVAKHLKMSETTVRAALGDLREANYMRSWTVRNRHGHVVGTRYVVDDQRHPDHVWEAHLTSLNTESAVSDEGGDGLTTDSVGRDSVGRESDAPKGDHSSKGYQVPKGPPVPPPVPTPELHLVPETETPGGSTADEAAEPDTAPVVVEVQPLGDAPHYRRLGRWNRTAHGSTAHQLVNEWAASCAHQPFREVLTEVAGKVESLLRQGASREHIAAGLADWETAGMRAASQLPRFVHRAANRPRTQTTDGRRRSLGEIASEQTREQTRDLFAALRAERAAIEGGSA